MNNASAAHTPVALRVGHAMPIFGGVTVQTMSADFGTSATMLPFTGTKTYDFYSPPLSNGINLTIENKGGGLIFMTNSGTTAAADFTVTGRMQYYDYDPATGANVLIVDTGTSGSKKITNAKLSNWSMSNVLLPCNITVPAGHMIHVAMTITLVSGNPAGLGSVVVNGIEGKSSAAFISQQADFIDWSAYWSTSYAYGTAAVIYSIAVQPDGTLLISCAGAPSTSYSLQASETFQPAQWNTIATTTSDSNGLFSYIDTEGPEYDCCYYRAFTTVP